MKTDIAVISDDDPKREREQWDELAAAASRLNTFCWAIDALRGNENPDVPEEINYMERAAWCEARHIGELVSSITSPFDT